MSGWVGAGSAGCWGQGGWEVHIQSDKPYIIVNSSSSSTGIIIIITTTVLLFSLLESMEYSGFGVCNCVWIRQGVCVHCWPAHACAGVACPR